MSRYLYFDGGSGISGDMVAAALIDLGASREKLDVALNSLRSVGEFRCLISRKSSYSIAGCDFEVQLPHDTPAREETYRDEPTHHHADPGHHHGHTHTHAHRHSHRHLSEVEAILDAAEITPSARALAKRIFRIVAEAEAEAHGVTAEQVHFHEVGAMDSLVDILSAAVLLDDLAPDGCLVPGLNEGQGTVMCQHGELPVPVPAVLSIARTYGIPLRPTSVWGEMVTPTGIAIAAALRTGEHLPPSYRVRAVGIGLGKRDFGRANFLRVLLVEDTASAPAPEGMETLELLECNIDDSSPEMLGHAMDVLLAAGARDVFFTPCHMKKNRPGVLLSLLAPPDLADELQGLVFRETSTIGIRRHTVHRACLAREMVTLRLPGGDIAAKKCTGYGVCRLYPEYESVRRYAEEHGLDYPDAYALALSACTGSDKEDGA